MLTLLVLQGPDKGRRFELPDSPAMVGRDSRQIPLSDGTASRRHIELLPTDGGDWILRDLGSSNGTYVNGARIVDRIPLKLGDQIRIGRTLLVFGAQPGVSRTSGGNVSLAGAEMGMDASIVHTVQSSEDSMVLAVPEPAAAAMNNLKVLYQLGAQLGSGFDANQVLEVVMDLVFEHVKADRGMILLLDERTNQLVPKVVRKRDEDAKDTKVDPQTSASAGGKNPDRHEKIHASRTIINHVLANGEGVLSSNAMADQRFSKGKSVHNLGIRSALCVPIKVHRLDPRAAVAPDGKPEASHDIVGVIYIDSSVKNYTYSPDQLRLLNAIGLQAGLAIQNATLFQQGLAAERLAAVGETVAALSHSIKNILQALRGGADVVEMGLRRTDLVQVSKGWGVVDRNLDKIYHLTMNLLSFSKPREPQMEMVNPRKLVDECLELIAAPAAAKSAMAVADVEKDHPAVPMDYAGMHQVLMNLLGNAVDAIEPERGLIRVECRFDVENHQAILEVSDNGGGIPAAMMKHMFELFHSTKGNRGTGLGLAVSKKIVEEHEGSISVRSTPGQGTTFTVRLPVYHASVGDPSHTHGPAK